MSRMNKIKKKIESDEYNFKNNLRANEVGLGVKSKQNFQVYERAGQG